MAGRRQARVAVRTPGGGVAASAMAHVGARPAARPGACRSPQGKRRRVGRAMATYHLRLGMVQRSRGQSVVAVAVDHARVRLHNHRLDRIFAPLPAKRGTQSILSQVLLPDGAPPSWRDRETLCNAIEAFDVGATLASPERLRSRCRRSCRASRWGIWPTATCWQPLGSRKDDHRLRLRAGQSEHLSIYSLFRMSVTTPNNRDGKRQAILQAADELFGRFGVAKTNVADIARACAISPAHLYNFYPSKQAIFEAVGAEQMSKVRCDIELRIAKRRTEWERISAMFETIADHFRRRLPNDTDILRTAVVLGGNRPEFLIEFHAYMRRRLLQFLQAGVASREFRDVDPAQTADAMLGCMANASEPLAVIHADREHHTAQVSAQLDLLHHALK